MPAIRAETLRVVAVCLALIVIPGATVLACSGRSGPNDPFDCTNQTAHPTDLACTGLYASWANKPHRDPVPLGVHTVGAARIAALRAWIDSMPRLSN